MPSMPEGELNFGDLTAAPAAGKDPAPDDLLGTLPEPLHHVGAALVRGLKEQQPVEPLFSNFCTAAYVKPEWAGVASEFLAELFAEQEDLLAEMTRIPDLIIELATGHITLTCMVASRWAARGETTRLARLAEALIATQSKMSGEGVVEVMLALATSLAITRYSKAEHLLTAATPQVTEEQKEALAEARLWLAAGRLVRSFSQEVRDLWDQRLRRSSQSWPWVSKEEREALLLLADQISESEEGARLFKAVVPPCWWDLAVAKNSATVAAAPQPAPPTEPLIKPQRPSPYADVERDLLPPMRWSPGTFLGGIAMGALSATVIFMLAQPHRWKTKTAPAVSVSAPADAAPASAENGVPTAPPPPSPEEEWRRKEIQALAAELPELEATAASVRGGTWIEQAPLLQGHSSIAPRESATYQKLLLWMHLDPPVDPELRSKIPSLLVELRQDESVLELWKRLAYAGSPIAEDIRNAAKLQIHRNTETRVWSDEQVRALEEIAGWKVANAAP
jgi:hypothetical protein